MGSFSRFHIYLYDKHFNGMLWVELSLQKRYVEVLTPSIQNVTLFGNKIVADIIS